MDQRTLIDRLLSPAGFGLVLLLFLLPFVTVSCGVTTDETTANFEQSFSFTGVDLLVGGSPDISVSGGNDVDEAEIPTTTEGDDDAVMAVFDERYGKYYPPQPLAIGAAVIIFAGMIIGLALPLGRRAWFNAGAAVLAAALLAVEVFVIAPGLADDAIADALADVEGATEAIASGALTTGTSPGLGFWIAIVILVGLAAWQAHVAYHGKTAPAGGLKKGNSNPRERRGCHPPAGPYQVRRRVAAPHPGDGSQVSLRCDLSGDEVQVVKICQVEHLQVYPAVPACANWPILSTISAGDPHRPISRSRSSGYPVRLCPAAQLAVVPPAAHGLRDRQDRCRSAVRLATLGRACLCHPLVALLGVCERGERHVELVGESGCEGRRSGWPTSADDHRRVRLLDRLGQSG